MEIRTFALKMRKDKKDFITEALTRLMLYYQIDNQSRMLELIIAEALTSLPPEHDLDD